MSVFQLFRRAREPEPARKLYDAAVARARDPGFYTACGVPDSVDGRFELVVLHVHLLLRRLKAETQDRPAADVLGQELLDTLFADMDGSLREMGVGDLSVGPKVKRMAQAFYGRVAAYDGGLAQSPEVLAGALRRNLYGTVQPQAAAVDAVAGYIRDAVGRLSRCPVTELSAGIADFGPMPDCRGG